MAELEQAGDRPPARDCDTEDFGRNEIMMLEMVIRLRQLTRFGWAKTFISVRDTAGTPDRGRGASSATIVFCGILLSLREPVATLL